LSVDFVCRATACGLYEHVQERAIIDFKTQWLRTNEVRLKEEVADLEDLKKLSLADYAGVFLIFGIALLLCVMGLVKELVKELGGFMCK